MPQSARAPVQTPAPLTSSNAVDTRVASAIRVKTINRPRMDALAFLFGRFFRFCIGRIAGCHVKIAKPAVKRYNAMQPRTA